MNRLGIALMIVFGLSSCAAPSSPKGAASSPIAEHPLILSQGQGEVRTWRLLESESPAEQKFDKTTHFIIKVDRQHGGSPDFWFGAETLPAGAGIPYHRHLHEDEVLYIVSGSAHVHVGSLEGDARPGAIVFIPRDTWVTLQPTNKAPISLVFAFNAPGFDRYMRCEAVLAGQRAEMMTMEEDQRCQKAGDVQYR
jgi:mannose-6-phosphate isomerase-like protein (cupin superfamily)